MIKHMPEGLTPFEDCGFARYPLFPLENHGFKVACRVEDNDAAPRLFWSVDDAPQAPLSPVSSRGGCYRFAISALPYGSRVWYLFRAGDETSEGYEADICREKGAGGAEYIAQNGSELSIRFETGLAISFTAGSELHMRCHFGETCGEPADEASLSLPDGFSLHVRREPFLCQLKRFSETLMSLEPPRMLLGANGVMRRVTVSWEWSPRHVWGSGERFDSVDRMGLDASMRVTEKFTMQGGMTYLPIPFIMTDKGYGLFRKGYIPCDMSFGETLSITQRVEPGGCVEDVLLLGAPRDMLSRFIELTGEPALPPEWAFGLWISANGWNSESHVSRQLEALREYGCPASVMVLEAWSDERTFRLWNGGGKWKDPAAMIRRVRESGLRLMLWQIPIIKREWDGEPGDELMRDEREAIENGYCVMRDNGQPYRITDKWFKGSLLLDFTNPFALEWWFGKRKYLLDMGVEGFKTDGGEFLFGDDARLYGGCGPLSAHNMYPVSYIGAYRNFMRENGVDGLTFSRAGYTGAQAQPAHWAGDQLSLWSELKAQLCAGLSAGLSGVLFWGFDTGGFAGELPPVELYLRATAMACFCPIMQWHSEPPGGQFERTHDEGFINDRSPWNLAEKLNDPRALDIAVDFARLREKLRPYLAREAESCVLLRRPMMAHLCIDYPGDARACAMGDEYMLGRFLLVAPVTDEGADSREVYLPCGEWENIFTRERFAGPVSREEKCDLSVIPVYKKACAEGAADI